MSKHRKNPDRPEPDYEVGYQKPPEEHKFKAGHKGFKRRKKKRIDFDEMAEKAFMRMTTVKVDGELLTMPLIQASFYQLSSQVLINPAKHMKPNLSLIQGAVSARDRAAGFDEKGVDITAEFRRRIEKLADRYQQAEAERTSTDDDDPSGS